MKPYVAEMSRLIFHFVFPDPSGSFSCGDYGTCDVKISPGGYYLSSRERMWDSAVLLMVSDDEDEETDAEYEYQISIKRQSLELKQVKCV